MKRIVFFTLATGLILSTGCSKNEEPAPIAPEETPMEQTQAAGKDLTQKAVAIKDQAAEKVTAIAEQTKAAAQEISQKAQTTIKNFTVSKNDVMADLDQPVAELKAKVETLGQSELLAYASTYKNVLLEKKEQLSGLTSQLKALPMGDILGEKGKALKDQVSQYTAQLSGLKERYSVYLDKLKALGVDLSSFGI